MRADWRRQALQLPSVGDLSEAAVRAAYWSLVGASVATKSVLDKERLRLAKRQLLFELGVRLPPSPGRQPDTGSSSEEAVGP
jgi:hypothetical protein